MSMEKIQDISLEPLLESDTVTLSFYNATKSQCDSDPLITAFGYDIDPKKPFKHKYLAISRDLEHMFSKGDTVIIEGTFVYDGYWIVADRMNKRWTKRVDLLVKEGSYMNIYKNVIIRKKCQINCNENQQRSL